MARPGTTAYTAATHPSASIKLSSGGPRSPMTAANSAPARTASADPSLTGPALTKTVAPDAAATTDATDSVKPAAAGSSPTMGPPSAPPTWSITEPGAVRNSRGLAKVPAVIVIGPA
jgi:hypothetical protein